jgi:hypothetical protein
MLMSEVRPVSADLLTRANLAAAEGPRGFENAMISIVQALSQEVSPDDLLAVTYRLQALAHLLRYEGEDIVGFTMSVDGKDYKLINDAALKAAAACPLSLPDRMSDVQFNRDRFLELALSFTEAEGNG